MLDATSDVAHAESLFQQGFTCAQAVLGGFAGRYGLTQDAAARLGCAFGGGIARTGQMCGAVSGALMVVGLAHGATTADDLARRETTYEAAKAFLRSFRALHGFVECQSLLGVNIDSPDGRAEAIRCGLFKTRCPAFVRDAARLVAETL